MKAMLKNSDVAAKKTATAQRQFFDRLHSLPAKCKDAVCHLDFSKPMPSRCSRRPMPPAKVFSLPRLCGSRSSKVTLAECKLHLLGPDRVKVMNAKTALQQARFKTSLGVAEMRTAQQVQASHVRKEIAKSKRTPSGTRMPAIITKKK